MIGNMKYGTDCTDPLKGVPLKCNPALLSVLKANSIGFQLEGHTSQPLFSSSTGHLE